MDDKLTASEAVFAFAASLTCHDGTLVIGSRHHAGPMAQLAGDFCRKQGFADPREDYHLYIARDGKEPR